MNCQFCGEPGAKTSRIYTKDGISTHYICEDKASCRKRLPFAEWFGNISFSRQPDVVATWVREKGQEMGLVDPSRRN